MEHAVAHHEHVLARAVGHVALLVQQDRLVVAGSGRLELREHRVDVLAGRLRRRRKGVRPDAAEARHLEADAVLEGLLAQVGAPRPHRDRHLDGVVARVEPHRSGAAEGDRPDVAGRHAVHRHRLVHRGRQLGHAVAQIHLVERGRAAQALEVVRQAEDRRPLGGVVGANAFEDARPVVEGVREDVDVGVLPRHEASVAPDLLGRLHGRTRPFSGGSSP